MPGAVCPRDEEDNLCSGHGQCAANDKFEPVCKCEEGFMGDLCQYGDTNSAYCAQGMSFSVLRHGG